MMNEKRKAELFDRAMSWIWEHTGEFDVQQYIFACDDIGFIEKEIEEDLCGCFAEDINNYFYGED